MINFFMAVERTFLIILSVNARLFFLDWFSRHVDTFFYQSDDVISV